MNYVISSRLDKWQWQEGKIKMPSFYWASHTRKVCIGVELLLLYNVYVVSVVLKVGVVKKCKLSCLKVLDNSKSRRSGLSWGLMQVKCCCMVRNLEIVEEADTSVAEAGLNGQMAMITEFKKFFRFILLATFWHDLLLNQFEYQFNLLFAGQEAHQSVKKRRQAVEVLVVVVVVEVGLEVVAAVVVVAALVVPLQWWEQQNEAEIRNAEVSLLAAPVAVEVLEVQGKWFLFCFFCFVLFFSC